MKVLVALFIESLEKRILAIKEGFKRGPKFLVDFFCSRTRHSARGFPFLLDFQDLLRLQIPFLDPVGLKSGKCGELFG